MSYILYALDNYKDLASAKKARLAIMQLISFGGHYLSEAKYIDKLISAFQKIISNNDANSKELINSIILIYCELFQHLGDDIWQYVQIPLKYM